MGAVTQRVPAGRLADLLGRPLPATLALIGEDGPVCLPVTVMAEADGPVDVFVLQSVLPRGGVTGTGAVVVDVGWSWFRLRAITWRGRLDLVDEDRSAGRADDVVRLRLTPTRTVAWDYGTLHEEVAQ